MKLRSGMYIRTTEGYICKILKLNKSFEDDGYLDHNDIDSPCIQEKNIVKVKRNLLDLVECFDLIYVDISPDNYGGIVVPRIAETYAELKRFISNIKCGSWVLKGVVARELLIKNCYMVKK